MLHPIGNIFMIMSKVILDKFVLVMKEHWILLERVMINLENGNQWLLKDVKHVAGLKNNLISTGQLEGCVTTFTDTTWKVTKGAMVVAKGDKVGTLYLCKGTTDSSIALAFEGTDATLWHHRLGHMSEKGMQIL